MQVGLETIGRRITRLKTAGVTFAVAASLLIGCNKEETAKPEAPAPAKTPSDQAPVVDPRMAALAGKWQVSKTVTATLTPAGKVRSSLKKMSGGTWEIDAEGMVLIRSKEGEVQNRFKPDASGRKGEGIWKDGTKSKAEKLED